VQQAKEKLHEMAQTLQVVNPHISDNQDVDILLQLYEDHRSHSVSSNEDFEDELQSSPKNIPSTEGLLALQRRSSLLNIGHIQK